jgi:hypothetical protein
MASSNQSLMNAVGAAANTGLNVFSSALDARQTADISNPTTAKVHDLLLDSMSMSYTQGQLVLADRNRPADQLDTAPRVVVAPGATPVTAGGVLPGADTEGFLSAQQLTDFVQRFNQQLAQGCTIPLVGTYSNTCTSVVGSGSTVFSSSFKNEGTSSAVWMKSWVASPLDTEDLSGVTVSVSVPYRGSYVIPGTTTRVTRVILKFQNSNGDYVRRPILLTQAGASVVAYGDQKDYFVWVRPRVSVAPDADDTYPYYPKYEAGLNLIVKSHYAGVSGIVMGAKISGPGLPTNRPTTREAFATEIQNRNGITDGVEVFDNTANGCSNLSVDPSVYVGKNSVAWSDAWAAYRNANYSEDARRTLYSGIIRWRATNTTCAPMFDFRRYYLSGQTYTLPKKGDAYSVTLYLNKANFDASGLTLPPGAQVSTIKNLNDTVVNIYKLPVEVKLAADALDIPATIPAAALPGVTDSTRQSLLAADVGTDRTVNWTRNRIYWPEGVGTDGQPINTPFINFNAGIFQSAFDQYRTIDSYSGNYGGSYKKYWDFLNGADVRSKCGETLASYKGADVVVYIQKKARASTTDAWPATPTLTTCPAGLTTMTALGSNWFATTTDAQALVKYQPYVARARVKYQFDRFTQVTENQTSRTLTWNYLLNKEAQGSKALCSSFTGYWSYRQAYVNMIDINGRMISERREVWSDYPNTATSLLGDSADVNTPDLVRAVEVTRPNMNADTLYLPFTVNTAGYESVTNFNIGKKGIIDTAKARSGDSCSPAVW